MEPLSQPVSARSPQRPKAVQRLRGRDAGEAVVIVDVEQFAAIRALHGAEAGEQVTRAVADSLRRCLRSDDRLALLRDDEFLAVLSRVPPDALPAIVARLRGGVEGLRLALAGRIWLLTCAIGSAATPRGVRVVGLEGLVREADAELHRLRRAGIQPGSPLAPPLR